MRATRAIMRVAVRVVVTFVSVLRTLLRAHVAGDPRHAVAAGWREERKTAERGPHLPAPFRR